jgi:hypothetical protein
LFSLFATLVAAEWEKMAMPTSGKPKNITDAIIQVTSENPDAEADEIKAVLLARGIEAEDSTVVRFRSLTRQFLRLGWNPP